MVTLFHLVRHHRGIGIGIAFFDTDTQFRTVAWSDIQRIDTIAVRPFILWEIAIIRKKRKLAICTFLHLKMIGARAVERFLHRNLLQRKFLAILRPYHRHGLNLATKAAVENILRIPPQIPTIRSQRRQRAESRFRNRVVDELKFLFFRKVRENHPIRVNLKPIVVVITKRKHIAIHIAGTPCRVKQDGSIVHLGIDPCMSTAADVSSPLFRNATDDDATYAKRFA